MRLKLAGCKELGKSAGANNYLGSRRKGSSRNNRRSNRRSLCTQWYISDGGCVDGGNPLGLGPCSISGGGIYAD
jgi:hypothetical protein